MSDCVDANGFDVSLMMHERRPEGLVHSIDGAVVNPLAFPEGYRYLGKLLSYEFGSELSGTNISTDELIQELSTTAKAPVNILDIGAGFGAALSAWQGEGHTAHGVSAHDYRKYWNLDGDDQSSGFTEGSYVVGDAQQLNGLPDLMDAYDLVVSKWCLLHLVDPVGTLEQAANKLAPGGLLAVSQIAIHKYKNDAYYEVDHEEINGEFLLGCFEAAGFKIRSEKIVDGGIMERLELVAQAPDSFDTIRFPIDYIEVGYDGYSRGSNPMWMYGVRDSITSPDLGDMQSAFASS